MQNIWNKLAIGWHRFLAVSNSLNSRLLLFFFFLSKISLKLTVGNLLLSFTFQSKEQCYQLYHKNLWLHLDHSHNLSRIFGFMLEFHFSLVPPSCGTQLEKGPYFFFFFWQPVQDLSLQSEPWCLGYKQFSMVLKWIFLIADSCREPTLEQDSGRSRGKVWGERSRRNEVLWSDHSLHFLSTLHHSWPGRRKRRWEWRNEAELCKKVSRRKMLRFL